MNLANKLTLARMIAVPIYFYMALYTDYRLLSLIVFALAALTDYLDGYIARKYSMITALGQLMDPLADKFLTLSAFTVFMAQGLISPLVLLIVTLREILISVFRAVAASKDIVIAASVYGKLKTVLQMATILVLHWLRLYNIDINLYHRILIWLMALATVLSAVDYIWKNKEVLKE
ncbi:MAG: CDP-diacylglycerol--glycerol-3-phosphate 3-phosphatidyltransferase [Tissierellia bacterium]|nr:CDP-diacylglycerol--glycerol-3-phosphate 3-phosphatidyltransferase [Tissierellia bacterium]